MANQLIQSGIPLCEIVKHKIIPGKRSFERIRGIGSQDELVPGNKDADRVIIEISSNTDFDIRAGVHEILIDEKRYKFVPDKESGLGGRTKIEGFIFPFYK